MWLQVEIDGEQDVIQRALAAPRKKNWAIFLLGGGHFAAAVFKGRLLQGVSMLPKYLPPFWFHAICELALHIFQCELVN